MLGNKPGHERRSTQSSLAQIDEQNGPSQTEIPRDIPTPARSDATPSSRMSYAGSIRSLKSEDADDIRAREEMDRINAEIMAEMEAERAGTPPKQTQAPRSLHRASSMSISNASIRSSISPSNASIRSSKLEDPEDVRAREEMARINAEIMAPAAAEQQEQRLSRQVYTPPSRPANSHQRRPTWFDQAKLAVVQGAHGVLKFKTEGADMEIVESPKEIEHPRAQEMKRSVESFVYDGPKHARLPTWADQATLPVVSGSHGTMKFKQEGADLEIVEARKSVEVPTLPQRSVLRLAPYIYNGPKHAQLPTWVDQATLPAISGSHGMLKFGNKGASMEVVAPSTEQLESKHNHLPTWADQSKLELVSGSWGKLTFRKGGADMLVIDVPSHTMHKHLPTWADQSKLDLVSGSWGRLSFHEDGADMVVIGSPKQISVPRSPMWADQASLPLVKGAHCQLSFSETGADMEAIQPTIIPEGAWFGKRASITAPPQKSKSRGAVSSPYITSNMPGNVKAREQEIKQKRISIPNGLGGATINHGRDLTRSLPENPAEKIVVAEVAGEKYDLTHPALKEIVQAVSAPASNSYWSADQSTLDIVRGSYGFLSFGATGAVTGAVKRDPFWVDQRTLPVVKGDHGYLSFGDFETIMKVRRRDTYWADQSNLSVMRGEHGKLVFTSSGAEMRAVRPNPYWADQKTLAVVKGSHGRLAFSADGQSKMEIVRPDPFWVDQSTLSVVHGSHGRLSFEPDGASMEIVRPDPYWVDQSTVSTVRGTHGRLAFSLDGISSLEIVRPDPYWSQDQREVLSMRGTNGRLIFGPEGASLKIVRPDPYWADQSALSTVQGSHGKLSFGPDGASLKVVRPDPYWSADQTKLEVLTATHAMLKFTADSARMEIPLSNRIYWSVNQAELDIVRGSHGILAFGAGGAIIKTNDNGVSKNMYWEVDQVRLKIMRGSHGSLRFTAEGAVVHLVKSANPYWESNQASLKVVRGSHGSLCFTTEGVNVEIVKSKSPYWVANQRSLKIIWGSHAQLKFAVGEAIVDAVIPSSLYWDADQKGLRVIQGSHGRLDFVEEEATIHAVQPTTLYWNINQARLPVIQGAHGIMSFDDIETSVKVRSLPSAYLNANQAKLDEVRGSHGILHFTTEGAAIQAQHHAEPKPASRDPFAAQAAYWADQAKLAKIHGNHARLSFNNSISSSVPHISPENGWNSPPNLETGDFFPDSESEAEEERPMLSKRTSFGPGAFASILNRVKDRVPIVTNLVGNGSYSSFSHDEESPITPTDSSPSTLSNQPPIDEPVIHTSPESSHPHHHSARFDENPVSAIYGAEENEVKLSPLPTQGEFQFDPVYGQPIPAPRNSPLLSRAPISTKPFDSVNRLASNNPFRRASVSRSERNEGMIERRKALFENGGK